MKKTIRFIFTPLFTILFTFSYGQNYIDYYNLCNEGDRLAYFDKYEKALHSFETAFDKVDYVHAKQYEKASQCAIQLYQYEKATVYAQKALLQGSDLQFLKGKIAKKFRKTEAYKQLSRNLANYQKQHLSSINLDYRTQIDSLYYFDQRVIRKNRRVKGKYQIDKAILPDNKYDLDSLIFKNLLELIETYGFPSEKNIGKGGYESVYIILHHNGRLSQNKEHLPMMKEALLKGEYLPKDYAWMYDQGRLFEGENPLFYYGVASNTISSEEKKEIDKIRAKYGIKPFAAFQIKHRGRTTIMKPLW